MKLLIISPAFPPLIQAGEADHAYFLSHQLAIQGCEVAVLTNNGVVQEGLHPLMTIYPVMHGWSWSNALEIIRVIKHYRPETILLFYSGGPLFDNHPMITFSPSFIKALFPQTRIVTQFENHFPPSGRSFVTWLMRKIGRSWMDAFGTLLRRSDRIIILSDRQGEVLAQQYPNFYEKSLVIPPPPLIPVLNDATEHAREAGRAKIGVHAQEMVIAYFGLIYPGKGLDVLVEAFHQVSKHRPHIRLIMIGGVGGGERGTRYEKRIKSYIKELGLVDKIIWTGGYVSGSDDPSMYLHAADLCVLPMERGIALNNSSLAAAVAHGLPVVAIRGENVEAPFKHTQNIFLCTPGNSQELAEAIISILENPEIYNQLQEGARKLSEEHFTWDVAVKRTLDACFA